ncbi:MAG: response regulator transcription factor [Coriobacteriales bacterium]|jgi:two-component system response regulator VicR|nr:response regulator transcription factor [Coriobacteriales bacterium]
MKILLADDEPRVQTLVQRIVEDGGYEFCSAVDGEEVFRMLEQEQPDLLILDVMMPQMDGFRVCGRLRKQGVRIPIIFLSAKGDIVDKGIGFSAGGDDYIVKPFSPDELLMRIQAHLRQFDRITAVRQGSITEGDIEIDLRRYRILRNGEEIPFTPKEFQILAFLAQHKGEIVTREQLIQQVWGKEFIGETSSVAVFIRKIREKIEEDPSHPQIIKTMRNVGYIFAG